MLTPLVTPCLITKSTSVYILIPSEMCLQIVLFKMGGRGDMCEFQLPSTRSGVVSTSLYEDHQLFSQLLNYNNICRTPIATLDQSKALVTLLHTVHCYTSQKCAKIATTTKYYSFKLGIRKHREYGWLCFSYFKLLQQYI